MMHVIMAHTLNPPEQTHACENITFPQLELWLNPMLSKHLLSFCALPGVIWSQGSSSTMKTQFVLLLSALSLSLSTVQSDDDTEVRNVFDLGVPDICLPGLHRKVSSLLFFFLSFVREFGVSRVFPKLPTTQSCQFCQPLLSFCFLYYIYYGLW